MSRSLDSVLRLHLNVVLEVANVRLEKDSNSVRAINDDVGRREEQLEAEMKQNAWVIRKPDRATLKIDRLPRLWYDIMRRLGPWFKLLAAAPDDPSLN